ncbi:Calmodulin [Diplonema papillatum]|nr:Calmodulin [Diplonema papillatum]KAJ9466179.1 Calmodulin [Diplonema papillatum]
MADQMTTEQIHEFRAAFNIFDKDGSGTIAIDELTEVLQSVGQATGRGEIEAMLEAADVDNSGEVDFPEFLTGVE